MNKILVILGPTSTGKTDIGLKLAKKINGELLACDSRQVYRGLDIGTGKAPSGISNIKYQISNGYWEMDGVKVWMYDVADPKVRYTAWDYVRDARAVIERIISVKKIPIVVGGSGLYLRGLLEGFDEMSDKDESLRKKLEQLSLEYVQKKLIELSPAIWEELNESERKNKRRLVRKIEIAINTNAKFQIPNTKLHKDDVLKIGLYAPRPILNERIDTRVDSRIKDGMFEEAKGLYENGLSLGRMKELGLEYGVLADFLVGEIGDVRDFREILKIKIHRFAKRQMTWFRNQEKEVKWFDICKKDYYEKVERLVLDWYNSTGE